MKIISSLYCHFSCHFNNNNHLISISMCVYTHTAAFSWLAAFLCGLRLRAKKKKKAESKHTYVCLSYCSLSKSPLWKRPFIELQRLALPKIAYYLSNIWRFLSSYLWVVFCNCWTIRGIIYHTMTFFLFLFFFPQHHDPRALSNIGCYICKCASLHRICQKIIFFLILHIHMSTQR